MRDSIASSLLAAVLATCGLCGAAWAAPPAAPAAKTHPQAERYAEGQVWEYRTRPADTGSLIKIQKIEARPEAPERGPIYHISIIGVRVVTPEAAMTMIQHAPVTRQTLDASVTRLADRAPAFPTIDEGIKEWREAKGGVFTISVAHIVDVLEQTVRKGMQGQ